MKKKTFFSPECLFFIITVFCHNFQIILALCIWTMHYHIVILIIF